MVLLGVYVWVLEFVTVCVSFLVYFISGASYCLFLWQCLYDTWCDPRWSTFGNGANNRLKIVLLGLIV